MHVPSSVTKLNVQTYFRKVVQEKCFVGFQVKRSQYLMAVVCGNVSPFSINLPQGSRKNCIFFS